MSPAPRSIPVRSQLPAIPVFDARSSGLIPYACARREEALKLRNACFAPAPPLVATPILKAVDALSMNWLRRCSSPYVEDIEALRHTLGFAGVAAINMGYQFGCTTGAALDSSGVPFMRRVLDWPLNGLGRAVEIVQMRGAAGEYVNVTWPGAAGVLTASAPGRFCAAINQAPLHRRTQGALLQFADMARHLRHTLKDASGWPPDHLLRYAFDTCRSFDDAVRLLSREKVARPVLFAIAGTKPHEMALIERHGQEGQMQGARLYRGAFATANDWQMPHPDWEGRGAGRDKRADNLARRALMQRAQVANADDFLWVAPPILNARTRLAVEMNAQGDVKVRGYERAPHDALASIATQDRAILHERV